MGGYVWGGYVQGGEYIWAMVIHPPFLDMKPGISWDMIAK